MEYVYSVLLTNRLKFVFFILKSKFTRKLDSKCDKIMPFDYH